eukprot:1376326-Amorphochlora_amoeboformis.AAC.1
MKINLTLKIKTKSRPARPARRVRRVRHAPHAHIATMKISEPIWERSKFTKGGKSRRLRQSFRFLSGSESDWFTSSTPP